MVTRSRISAFRRSPRSIEHLCRGECLHDLTKAQSALVISLAHLSGWSAERIAVTIKNRISQEVSAEDIWHYCWRWILLGRSNDQDFVSEDDRELMKAAIKEAMIDMEVGKGPARPLHKTVEPVTVPFAERWSPLELPPIELCEGYTPAAREKSKGYLILGSWKAYGALTPTEEPIIARFGSTVECIVKKTLRHWSREMKTLLDDGTSLQDINKRDHVNLVMKHLDIFHESWEKEFGMMEIPEAHNGLQASKSSEIFITTTGYGCKVLLGLMMADRIHMVDRKRKQQRLQTCFLRVDVETLDDDLKECFVCKNQMGVEDEDGVKEQAIRLTICCDKVIGEDCIKKWCEAKGKKEHDCPFCRGRFTDRFWMKLFEQLEDPISYDRPDGVSIRPEEMGLMLSRGESPQILRGHSEPGSPPTHHAQSPSSIVSSNPIVSSPDTSQRSRSGSLLVRWGDVARSRRLNIIRAPGSRDDFDCEG
ncbi:hypothetical protein ONS96_009199 [Cadophora gregata f. sp. sojae]|nr:hypothetical protein ONS96_009199 [Cadophora gregata f. sp. sojae]